MVYERKGGLGMTLKLFSWAATGRIELLLTEKEDFRRIRFGAKEQVFGSRDFDLDRPTDIQEAVSSIQVSLEFREELCIGFGSHQLVDF